MPWWCVLVALLVGCNQVFGIDPTQLETEGPVDPKCPSDGVSVPLFRDEVHEIVSRNCFSYTISEAANLAVAMCNDRGTGATLESGPVDNDALEVVDIARMPVDAYVAKVWLAPGGDELVVHQHLRPPDGSTTHWLSLYRRSGATWTWSTHISESTAFITGGVPSATAERRVFESTLTGYRELAERDGSWQEVRRGTWPELGLENGIGDNLNLSSDGLRLTFTGSFDVYYSERASLDVPFRPGNRLDTIGQARDAFLVENCGKVYFSGLSSVFFRYQQ